MNIVSDIQAGCIKKWGIPEAVIETLLSHVFFFEDTVVKVYKHKKEFYGDMTDFTFRKKFYTDDFFWNQTCSPDIYVQLGGFLFEENVTLCSAEVADDFYILMKRVDLCNTLTQELKENNIGVTDVEYIIQAIVKNLRILTKDKKRELDTLFTKPWLDLHVQNLNDLGDWMKLTSKIDNGEIDELVTYLKNVSLKEAYFTEYNQSLLTVSIDNNPDNLLYKKNELAYLDIMTPKENWKVNDEFFSIVRTAVDFYVLGSEELYIAAYDTYAEYQVIPSAIPRLVYEIRSAAIHWAYRYILDDEEMALRYKEFVYKRLEELKNLV